MIQVIRNLWRPNRVKNINDLRWYHYAHWVAALLLKVFNYLAVLAICLIGLGLVTRAIVGLVRFGYCGRF